MKKQDAFMRSTMLYAVSSIIFCSGCGLYSSNASDGIPNVTVHVHPPSVALSLNGQQQFTASVSGTANTAVTWGVTGLPLGYPDFGTITQNGLYTAPSSVAGAGSNWQATVYAYSQANALDQGTANVTIAGGPLAALRGSYRLILLGSDADGAVSLSGKFEADGTGQIREGEMRMCSTESGCTNLLFEGTYKLDTTGNAEIVVDVLPGAILHELKTEDGRLTVAVDGKNGLRATGLMTVLTKVDPDGWPRIGAQNPITPDKSVYR